MSRCVITLLAFLPMGFAPAPFLVAKPGSTEADAKALEGNWEEVVCANRGRSVAAWRGGRPVYTATFADGYFTIFQSGEAFSRCRFTLSHTGKAREMVFDRGDGDARWSYRLEGDSLSLICGAAVFIYKRRKVQTPRR